MRPPRILCTIMLALGALLTLSISPTPARAAAPVVVTDCTRDGLETAIEEAATTDPANPGIVTFNCTDNIIEFTSPIIIGDTSSTTTAVRIDGSNNGSPIILDGIADDQIDTSFFLLADIDVHLNLLYLTFQHGGTTYTGGAIYNSGGTLTINQSTFTSNQATFGGAIYNQSGTLTINQSTFTSNQSTFTHETFGGGGAIYNSSGILTINQSTFSHNQSVFVGGAIQNFGTLTINQSTFSHNQATTLYGGAIYHIIGALTISQSSFINNQAGSDGGAIANTGTLTVASSTFSGNTASVSGSTIVISSPDNTTVSWSTIIQPPDTSPALYLGSDLTLIGVILGGDGQHCNLAGGTNFDSYSLANETSCELDGQQSNDRIPYSDGLANLGLDVLKTVTVNGVQQSYYAPLSAPSLNGGPPSCDTDILDGPDPDQLGNPRPIGPACDIGAIEHLSTTTLCANTWTGALHVTDDCSRSEQQIVLPFDGPIPLCVNNWNGATHLGPDCDRSEHLLTIRGNGTIPVCINIWNGTLRVSDHCTRSEHSDLL